MKPITILNKITVRTLHQPRTETDHPPKKIKNAKEADSHTDMQNNYPPQIKNTQNCIELPPQMTQKPKTKKKKDADEFQIKISTL